MSKSKSTLKKAMQTLDKATILVIRLYLENLELKEKLKNYEDNVMPEVSEYVKNALKAHKAGENG